jgi:hypothetical protein
VPAETVDTTQTGHPERRRVRYLTYREFVIWAIGMMVAWLLILVAAVGAAWLAWTNDATVDRNGADAIYRACVGRAAGDIQTAVAIDQLRRLAVSPNRDGQPSAAQRERSRQFLERTQEPIDRLLSNAASRRITTKPGTALSRREQDRVRFLANSRCQQAATDFLAGSIASTP